MNTENYKIRLSYVPNGKKQIKTICKIIDKETETVIVEGVALKNPKDNNDKKYGRFLAFKRAMSRCVLKNKISRENRTEIWNTFKNKTKLPETVSI